MLRRTITLATGVAALVGGLFVSDAAAVLPGVTGGVQAPIELPGTGGDPLLPPAGDDDVWACAYIDVEPGVGACVYNPLQID